MRKIQGLFILSTFLTIATGCNSFERELYSQIELAGSKTIEANQPTVFNLNSITDFEWDSVFVVTGNESVPVFRDEIQSKLGRPANDLKTYRDRYYFLTPDKKLVIKEVEAGIYRTPAIDIGNCLSGEGDIMFWLSNNECKFFVVPNNRTLNKGTIFALPNCETKFNPNNFGIFYQK
ncbi:hypothetical protein [Ekhidna sp.]|uniref:hypothetical protein n=1 Tax=Ekhidna sp. TaxID=2608089 RepID=UPI003B59199E